MLGSTTLEIGTGGRWVTKKEFVILRIEKIDMIYGGQLCKILQK